MLIRSSPKTKYILAPTNSSHYPDSQTKARKVADLVAAEVVDVVLAVVPLPVVAVSAVVVLAVVPPEEASGAAAVRVGSVGAAELLAGVLPVGLVEVVDVVDVSNFAGG